MSPDGDSFVYSMIAVPAKSYSVPLPPLSSEQGADTGFQSSRLNTVSAFPLSGTMPFVQSWREFIAYFEKMRGFRIVESMKNFCWDIRPEPEYGHGRDGCNFHCESIVCPASATD